MIERLIAWSIRRRELVALGAVFVLVAGLQLLRTMPVDAIPDLSDTQVIVYTDYPGQAPQVVEDQVTYPLLTTFLAVPKESRARAVDVQLVLRVRDLPGPDGSLLGALTRARVPERDSKPAPRRRQDPAGAGRHRRGLGLSVRPRGSRIFARPAPLDPGLPGALRASVRGRRGGGRESGRVRAPIPGAARPGPAPWLRGDGSRGHGRGARGQPGRRGAHRGSRGLGLRNPRAGLLPWSRGHREGRSPRREGWAPGAGRGGGPGDDRAG